MIVLPTNSNSYRHLLHSLPRAKRRALLYGWNSIQLFCSHGLHTYSQNMFRVNP